MVVYAQRWSSTILALSLAFLLHAPARAEKHPAEGHGVKSTHGDVATLFRIVNGSGKTVEVYWLNYEGEREHKATLKDGETFDQHTFLTHPWLVTDQDDSPLGLYYADAQPRVVRVTAAGKEPADDASAPPTNSPELDALAPYARQFDVTSKVKHRDQEGTLQTNGKSEGHWIHGGQYLRQTWSIESNDRVPAMDGSSIMTFDPRMKAYRRWSFISTGPVEESRGEWDEKSRTMTWTADDNVLGGKTVTKSTFGDDGNETWSIHFYDGDDELVTEVSGTATPRKDNK